MHLSGLHRRHPAPSFVDHTPREFEITSLSPSQSPEMFASASMAVGAGPLFTNAIMGQTPSAAEREELRKASSTILREDSIRIEEEPADFSRPDSWSMHCVYTNQAPYSMCKDDDMMTATSHLHLPKENPSADLAFFLRTTGPAAPHRRPSKIEHPRKAVAAPKKALSLLRIRQRRPNASAGKAHDRSVKPGERGDKVADFDRLNGDLLLRDEGGLLSDIVEEPPKPPVSDFAEQRQTSSGKEERDLEFDLR